jgi:hypothetical protein
MWKKGSKENKENKKNKKNKESKESKGNKMLWNSEIDIRNLGILWI